MSIMNRWTLVSGAGALRLLAGVVTVAALLSGCEGNVGWLDRKDRADPLMRRAESRAKEGDIQSAVRLYTAALDSNPSLALAHLQLALLYHDQLKDYVQAIYHYRRYQQLRGETQKAQMIEDRIRMAGQLFAASLNRGDSRAMEKVELEKENADLKATVERLNADADALRQKYDKLLAAVRQQAAQSQTIDVKSAPTALPGGSTVLPEAGGNAGSTQPGAEPRRVVRTYRVRSGDSLTSIAGQLYGDPTRWPQIQAANRRQLGSTAAVKVGQVLVIP